MEEQTHVVQVQSQEINELAKALSIAQGKIESASMDKENPFYKSKYADLFSVWGACRETLTSNGLSVVQTGRPSGNGKCIVITTLMHSSGQWIRGEMEATPAKQDPQGIGSCITYLRRYSLAAMVGVCPEDDDGNGSLDRENSAGKPVDNRPKKKYKNFKFLGTMKGFKVSLGEEKYYEIIGKYGCEHSNEIPPKDQKAIWKDMVAKQKEVQG